MILSFWILLGQKGANFQGPFAAFGIGSSFGPLPSLPRTNSHFAPEDEGEMGPKIFHYSQQIYDIGILGNDDYRARG